MLRKVRLRWPPSKPIQPQPAAARQPTPRPGCVQDLALKRIQSGEEDVDLWSRCKSSSSLIEQEEEQEYLLQWSWPLAKRQQGAALLKAFPV